VRAGDARDRTDLIAPGDYRSRPGLARIGQELIDQVQRRVGRTRLAAGLIPGLI
jgi:hypothetical protein